MNQARCWELINQAYGSMEEKLDCARLGYSGNIPPRFRVYSIPDAPLSVQTMITESSITGNGKMRTCNKCNCNGNGGNGGNGSGQNGSASSSSSMNGGGVNRGFSGIKVNAELPWLIVIVLLVVFAARKD